jgi:hypothetical protein
MVTNTELTIDQITYEALRVLKNRMALGNRCLRTFDGSFGQQGAKIGDSLRVRVPIRTQSTNGPAPAAQNFTETYKVIAAQQQLNQLFQFTTKDMALALDDMSDRFIEPVMAQMASDIDGYGTAAAVSGSTVTNSGYVTANYAGTYAGFMGLATPGSISSTTGPAAWTGVDLGSGASAPNTALSPFYNAQAALTNQSAPMNDRYCVLAPNAVAATAPNLLTLFNPSGAISGVYEDGILAQIAGAKFFESQTIGLFTSGTWSQNANVAITSNGTTGTSTGDTVLSLGRTGTSTTIVAGDQFVVAGVYSVNPLTRLSTNRQQIFTVTANVTGNAGGNVIVSIYPPIANAGSFQTVTAVPTVQSNVVFMGTSNTSTAANFMYHKDAIAMVVAPLSDDLPGAEVSRVSDGEGMEDDGASLSLRYVAQYVATSDLVVKRIDILFGWGVVRPELGCRIQA